MPQLVTDRLILRPYRAGEAHLVHRLLGDPRVVFWRRPLTLAEAQALLDEKRALPGGLGWWAAFLNDAVGVDGAPVLIGQVLLQPLAGTGEIEIGWHVLPERWGNGYATEAARALLGHAFTALGLGRVAAVVLPGNARSLGVIHKLGFTDRGERVHAGVPHRYLVLERHGGEARAPARPGAAVE